MQHKGLQRYTSKALDFTRGGAYKKSIQNLTVNKILPNLTFDFQYFMGDSQTVFSSTYNCITHILILGMQKAWDPLPLKVLGKSVGG